MGYVFFLNCENPLDPQGSATQIILMS